MAQIIGRVIKYRNKRVKIIEYNQWDFKTRNLDTYWVRALESTKRFDVGEEFLITAKTVLNKISNRG